MSTAALSFTAEGGFFQYFPFARPKRPFAAPEDALTKPRRLESRNAFGLPRRASGRWVKTKVSGAPVFSSLKVGGRST